MTTALRPVLLFRPAAWYDTAELATRASMLKSGGEAPGYFVKGAYYKTNGGHDVSAVSKMPLDSSTL